MAKFDWEFNFKNIGQFYECFLRHGSQNAVKQCLTFVDLNAKELVKDLSSFVKLPYKLVVVMLCRDTFCAKEVDICSALIEWQREHQECDHNDLFRCIRWNLISKEDFYDHIRPTEFISDDQYFSFSLRNYPNRICKTRNVVPRIHNSRWNGTSEDRVLSTFSAKKNLVTSTPHKNDTRNQVIPAIHPSKVINRSGDKTRPLLGYKRALLYTYSRAVQKSNVTNPEKVLNPNVKKLKAHASTGEYTPAGSGLRLDRAETVNPKSSSDVGVDDGESNASSYASFASSTSLLNNFSLTMEEGKELSVSITPVASYVDLNNNNRSFPGGLSGLKKNKGKKKVKVVPGLTQHSYAFDEESQKFRCNVCGQLFGRRDHCRRHLYLHFEPSFQCSMCERKFHTREVLCDHERGHAFNHTCYRCGKSGFATYSNMIGHQKNSKCRLLDATLPEEVTDDSVIEFF